MKIVDTKEAGNRVIKTAVVARGKISIEESVVVGTREVVEATNDKMIQDLTQDLILLKTDRA